MNAGQTKNRSGTYYDRIDSHLFKIGFFPLPFLYQITIFRTHPGTFFSSILAY